MFTRKKRNARGSVSVQVMDKTKDSRVIKTIGPARTSAEIVRLVALGKAFIESRKQRFSLFRKEKVRNAAVIDFLSHVRNSRFTPSANESTDQTALFVMRNFCVISWT